MTETKLAKLPDPDAESTAGELPSANQGRKPGLYLNVPFDEYLAIDAIHSTALNQIARSPSKYKFWLDHPADTPDLLTGRVAHTCILEPDKFDDTYMARDKPNLRTKAGKQEWADVETEAKDAGKTVIPMEDYNLATRMRDSIRAHPKASKLLGGTGGAQGDHEATLIWNMYGVPCKARIDYLPPDGCLHIVDLKSTRSSDPYGFPKSVQQYGYHVQAAWYLMATEHCLTTPRNLFFIIAVEKSGPCDVSVFTLDDETLLRGREIAEDSLLAYRSCMETGRWPGYSDDVQEISLPAYALNGDDDGIDAGY